MPDQRIYDRETWEAVHVLGGVVIRHVVEVGDRRASAERMVSHAELKHLRFPVATMWCKVADMRRAMDVMTGVTREAWDG